MSGDVLAVDRSHLTGFGRQVLRQERTEITLTDEADAGAVFFVVHRQRGIRGRGADLGLAQFSNGKQRARQLRLAKGVEEVTLVLVVVAAAQQPVYAVPAVAANVMAGRDELRPEVGGVFKKGFELDLAVTEDVGVRGSAGPVLGQEVLEYAVPVFRCKISPVQVNAQQVRHRLRIGRVRLGRAGTPAIVFFPVLHEHPGNRLAGLLQQQRRNRRIHAA